MCYTEWCLGRRVRSFKNVYKKDKALQKKFLHNELPRGKPRGIHE
jgi:hypothetical protein